MITEVNAPRINTNDDILQVAEWLVKKGDKVHPGQEIVVVETSKAVVNLSVETEGYLDPLVAPATIIAVGKPLYRLATTPEELGDAPTASAAPAVSAPVTPAKSPSGHFGTTRLSKEAARVLKEKGLTEADLQGAGLVTARSLRGESTPRRVETSAVRSSAPQATGPMTDRVERSSLAKQAEIQSLSIGESGNLNSKLTIQFNSAPLRARLQNEGSFDGNVQPVLVYEISRLIKQWPQFTAYYQEGSVHYYDRVDIGLAFDLGKGLKVVTLKAADQMMPIDIFERTIEIGLRYTENRLSPEELTGSTVTITDLSGFDILDFHPLINGHQSMIIGIGGDSARPGHPMALHATFDHRVTNGREVALFLKELRQRLLTYAEAEAPRQTTDMGLSPDIVGLPQACDICGIDGTKYYQDYGLDAYLTAYFREDGTLGRVCHLCSQGIN